MLREEGETAAVRGVVVEAVEDDIELVGTIPDFPHVVLLQLLLHFPPVGVFCLVRAPPDLPLCGLYCLFLTHECHLLSVLDSLNSWIVSWIADFLCYPRLVIWLTSHRQDRPHPQRS